MLGRDVYDLATVARRVDDRLALLREILCFKAYFDRVEEGRDTLPVPFTGGDEFAGRDPGLVIGADDLGLLVRERTDVVELLETISAIYGRTLLGLDVPEPATAQPRPPPAWEPTLFREPAATDRVAVDGHSSAGAKIALFRSLFAGRDDVYAARWENERSRKSGWSPVVVGGPANARRPDRAYVPLGDGIIEAHLTGRVHVGLYPFLRDDGCRLLACDFDGPTWPLDAGAFVDAAEAAGIPVALERSRSGQGAHVWMFFTAPVPASAARRVGAYLLSATCSNG